MFFLGNSFFFFDFDDWWLCTNNTNTVKFRRNVHPNYIDIKSKLRGGRTFGSSAKNYKKVATPPTRTAGISRKQNGQVVSLLFKIEPSAVSAATGWMFSQRELPGLLRAAMLAGF